MAHHRPTRTSSLLCLLALALLGLLVPPPLSATGDEDVAALLDPESVMAVTREQFEDILEHHRGKVVLVNFWATWCIPCIQELPEIDELQHRYREDGLQVLAVSFDDLEDLEEKVQPFFAEKAPHLVSYIQAEEDPFDFAAGLAPEWVGALPMSFILDRFGELHKRVSGRLTFRSFEDAILPLLAEDGDQGH
jgi:thiol-disulfide isomerase/thioredoxin